jgi:hypothetical protein
MPIGKLVTSVLKKLPKIKRSGVLRRREEIRRLKKKIDGDDIFKGLREAANDLLIMMQKHVDNVPANYLEESSSKLKKAVDNLEKKKKKE